MSDNEILQRLARCFELPYSADERVRALRQDARRVLADFADAYECAERNAVPNPRSHFDRYTAVERGSSALVRARDDLLRAVHRAAELAAAMRAVRRTVAGDPLQPGEARDVDALRAASQADADALDMAALGASDVWLPAPTEAVVGAARALKAGIWADSLDEYCAGGEFALERFSVAQPEYARTITAADMQPIVTAWPQQQGRLRPGAESKWQLLARLIVRMDMGSPSPQSLARRSRDLTFR